MVMANREDPARSLVGMTSKMNSSSQIMKATFFMTPAGSSLGVKMN
jgi:hypothetical protein